MKSSSVNSSKSPVAFAKDFTTCDSDIILLLSEIPSFDGLLVWIEVRSCSFSEDNSCFCTSDTYTAEEYRDYAVNGH